MPPVNSITTVFPEQGNALLTVYTIRVTNSKDGSMKFTKKREMILEVE